MYEPLCGEELEGQSYTTPTHKASLSPKRPRQDQRHSVVSAALWVGVGIQTRMVPPRGVPIAQTAHARRGLGCMCRYVGRG